MSEERKRPIKLYEVVVAHGPYRKGDRIQPTGMYRGELLRRGLIREVMDAPAAEPLELRAQQPEMNRMVGGELATRRQKTEDRGLKKR